MSRAREKEKAQMCMSEVTFACPKQADKDGLSLSFDPKRYTEDIRNAIK